MTQLNLTDRLHQITLPPEAHRWAQLFASKQSDVPTGKQVYYNTLSVFAVDDYLHTLGIATNLEDSDSWYPGLTSPPDSAELKLVDLGAIECRPVLAAATEVVLPFPGDEIAYVVVQLSADLDTVTFCGYAPANTTGTIALASLRPIEYLTNYLGKLRDGVDRLENLDLEQFDPLMSEFLAELSDRGMLSLIARSIPIYESSARKLSKKLEISELFGSNFAGVGIQRSANAEQRSLAELQQEDKIRNLAEGWLEILNQIFIA
ncbi:MAG: DUF1822 family protein [Chamaesiphon sp.]|nr:DUF1822 family protein [Chamaesiphon sp.]